MKKWLRNVLGTTFLFNVDVHIERKLIISNQTGTKIQLTPEIIGYIVCIPSEGVMIYGDISSALQVTSFQALVLTLTLQLSSRKYLDLNIIEYAECILYKLLS
jgi:hypothetical protein